MLLITTAWVSLFVGAVLVFDDLCYRRGVHGEWHEWIGLPLVTAWFYGSFRLLSWIRRLLTPASSPDQRPS
jgi:hypothetical protein